LFEAPGQVDLGHVQTAGVPIPAIKGNEWPVEVRCSISDIVDRRHTAEPMLYAKGYREFVKHRRQYAADRALFRPNFATPDASQMDFVFTVCDNAAGEACPFWAGQPMTAHWGVEDPAAVEGTDIEKERAFAQASRYLRNRITAFIALPIKSLDKISLTRTCAKSEQ
jgi:hypothetical protein